MGMRFRKEKEWLKKLAWLTFLEMEQSRVLMGTTNTFTRLFELNQGPGRDYFAGKFLLPKKNFFNLSDVGQGVIGKMRIIIATIV